MRDLLAHASRRSRPGSDVSTDGGGKALGARLCPRLDAGERGAIERHRAELFDLRGDQRCRLAIPGIGVAARVAEHAFTRSFFQSRLPQGVGHRVAETMKRDLWKIEPDDRQKLLAKELRHFIAEIAVFIGLPIGKDSVGRDPGLRLDPAQQTEANELRMDRDEAMGAFAFEPFANACPALFLGQLASDPEVGDAFMLADVGPDQLADLVGPRPAVETDQHGPEPPAVVEMVTGFEHPRGAGAALEQGGGEDRLELVFGEGNAELVLGVRPGLDRHAQICSQLLGGVRIGVAPFKKGANVRKIFVVDRRDVDRLQLFLAFLIEAQGFARTLDLEPRGKADR